MEKLKNFGKIVGVILGFIVFIAAFIAFWIWIAWLSEKLFMSCICVAAGIGYFFLHLYSNKNVNDRRNRWISAVTFAIGFCSLPITIYFPKQSWVSIVAVALLGIGTLVWLFKPFNKYWNNDQISIMELLLIIRRSYCLIILLNILTL